MEARSHREFLGIPSIVDPVSFKFRQNIKVNPKSNHSYRAHGRQSAYIHPLNKPIFQNNRVQADFICIL